MNMKVIKYHKDFIDLVGVVGGIFLIVSSMSLTLINYMDDIYGDIILLMQFIIVFIISLGVVIIATMYRVLFLPYGKWYEKIIIDSFDRSRELDYRMHLDWMQDDYQIYYKESIYGPSYDVLIRKKKNRLIAEQSYSLGEFLSVEKVCEFINDCVDGSFADLYNDAKDKIRKAAEDQGKEARKKLS